MAAIEDSETLASVLREPLGLYKDETGDTLVTGATPFKDFLDSYNQDRVMMADIIDGLLDEIKSQRKDFEKEIEKLKQHRHDFSKSYSGRPEL